jgi:hypothetical protein
MGIRRAGSISKARNARDLHRSHALHFVVMASKSPARSSFLFILLVTSLLSSAWDIVLTAFPVQINLVPAPGSHTPLPFCVRRIWLLYILALKARVPTEILVSANGWLKADFHRVVLVWGSETALMEGYDGSTALPLDDWFCVRRPRC